jgi:hypothetical protein
MGRGDIFFAVLMIQPVYIMDKIAAMQNSKAINHAIALIRRNR